MQLAHVEALEASAQELVEQINQRGTMETIQKPQEHYLLQFFSYSHLPEKLQAVSKPFGELAQQLVNLPNNPEQTTALRKLLEAKDCAVRALLFQPTKENV